jgi:hypothetical protein
MDINTKQFGYTHHYVVDELDINKLPGDCTPAAHLLSGQPLPEDTLPNLQEQLMTVEPDISPWHTDTLVNHLDDIPNNICFGFMLNVHNGYGHLSVESLIPGSFVFDLRKEKHLEGLFLLAINRIEICTLTDATAILDDVYN